MPGSATKRDPRIDQRPGDVLEFGKHKIRMTITLLAAGCVRYSVPLKGRYPLECECTLTEFRRLFATAEVIAEAPDAR